MKLLHFLQGLPRRLKRSRQIDGQLQEAFPPMSVVMTLEDEIDISRGDMIAKPTNQPEMTQDVDLMICWLNQSPLKLRGKYVLKHTSNEVRCIVKDIRYKMNINTLHRVEDDQTIKLNDIGRILIRTTKPLLCDSYKKNRGTGSVILVDEFTNETVGAGMIL